MIRCTKIIRREGLKYLVRYLSDEGRPCKPDCPCPPIATPDPCPAKPQPSPPSPPKSDRCIDDSIYSPCNYCPPPCPDPDYPDLTKLKRNQCLFQKDDGNPIWLKGPYDKLLFQVACVLTAGCFLNTLYCLYVLMKAS